LIPGFVEALVGAKLGSKLVVVIPPDLGYGEQGNSTIPGNATLVFVIEVLGIDKPLK
jgi:peptidylprolyl isomerase